jgi:hypothetical protein
MFTRIQDIDDMQGAFIRRILGADMAMPLIGALTPAMVADAHARYVPTRPGAPVPHESRGRVVMFIAKGKWKGLCPECRCGVTTGAGWTEVRCFECGAVLTAIWPEDRTVLEQRVLARPPVEQWWHPDQE